ncbi:cation:proton antiporter [Candidatus Micrarchaeota archaeon]|nr:cation:proton antiporter [Candidatus Micrarchaeota archaeon]MBU2477035.1 cation:proton antiporter [Candidatus Micrarchaeota archaeon]
MEIMLDLLLLFFVVILVTFVFGEIFFRFGVARIIGQIIAGLFLGLPFFAGVIPLESNSLILLLSEIGIIFLLILTGLEIDFKKIMDSSKEVILIAFFSALVPFVFGFGFAFFMGYPLIVCFVLGATLSLTAEGTKTITLMQAKVLKTKLGEIMILSGTADDVFELLFLAVLLVLVGGSSLQGLILLPVEVIAFFVFVFVALKLLPKFVSLFKQESDDGFFTLAVLIGLGIALLSSALSLGPIVGALMAGLLLQKAIKSQKVEHAIENHLRIVTFGLVIPFFYVNVGLNFNFHDILLFPVIALVVLFIAFTGKMAGVIATKPFSKLKMNQLLLTGWAMNSRGAMELVILEVARQKIPGFPMQLYAAIVFMTIITTVAFPLALQYYLKKYPDIMD